MTYEHPATEPTVERMCSDVRDLGEAAGPVIDCGDLVVCSSVRTCPGTYGHPMVSAIYDRRNGVYVVG